MQGNHTPDYDICTGNKCENIKNQANIGSKEMKVTKKNSWQNKNR